MDEELLGNGSADDNCSLYPAIYPGVILAVKITAGTTCILSLFGASLIILTYVAFKDLRTTARQLLVNLSIADIIVTLSHFIGLFTNYERFLCHYNPETWNTSATDPLCITQGAFSMFGNEVSFLWSLAIALYMLVVVVCGKPRIAKKLVVVFYIICWGVPIGIIIPIAVKHFFGFTEVDNPGWCFTIKIDTSARDDSTVALIFGYSVWVYTAFLLLPVFYILLFFCLRWKARKNSKPHPAGKGDVKLLFVPLIFFLLRIWSTIVDAIVFYSDDASMVWEKYRESSAAAAIIIISAIGYNAQGLANAILFCVFTKQVRNRLTTVLVEFVTCQCIGRCKRQRFLPLEESAQIASHSGRSTSTYDSFYDNTIELTHSDRLAIN